MMAKVHLIGIGGSGLSAIARVLLESGYTVSGSDRASSPLAESLRAAGVRLMIGHQAGNIAGADVVVRSSAIPDDNPEVVAARSAGIPVLKRVDFLGRLLQNKHTIAVAGSHGKTTTTAMIAWLLTEFGADPSFIVGGVLKNLETNARAGKGQSFVIEADEYDHMFLGLNPSVAVITNIEYDHPDCYPTPADYRQAFIDFVHRLEPGGWLLACGDDPGAVNLLNLLAADAHYQPRVDSYGINPGASYLASQVVPNRSGGFDFSADYAAPGAAALHLADVSLQVPGVHNVVNAMAALSVAHHLGFSMAAASKALQAFQGSGRRFEVVGEAGGVVVINDYAHHPTEIRATLAAARARYPDRRIWAVWQPHTYSRTQALRTEFAAAFTAADQVVVTEIYAAREPALPISSAALVASMSHPAAHFVPSLSEVTSFLLTHLSPGDVVLVLSAGDADQVSLQVLAALQNSKG